MEKSPFFPSLLQSALPSSIIILSRISLLYRRAFVTVDLPNFTRLRNRPKDVTERNQRERERETGASAGASGFPLCRYDVSITYIYTRPREIALSMITLIFSSFKYLSYCFAKLALPPTRNFEVKRSACSRTTCNMLYELKVRKHETNLWMKLCRDESNIKCRILCREFNINLHTDTYEESDAFVKRGEICLRGKGSGLTFHRELFHQRIFLLL